MEDVYSIKVKTQPDTRNVYPSERRYSASTVSGLAWVHIALASTSFLLACLALVNPQHAKLDTANINTTFQNNTVDETDSNSTDTSHKDNLNDYNNILVIAPSLLTIFALAAGLTSILASVRWYIDRNITWLFIMSILSTLFSLISFIMVAVWFVNTSEGNDDITEFYKDRIPFKDVFVIKHTDILDRNESHIIIARNSTTVIEGDSHMFTKRVLSINILIASFLELLWSLLSAKISYKGMRNNYKEDDAQRRGNCISVVTKIKGNTKKMSRNGKILPPKPDLIDHYPSKKIKRIFLSNDDLNKNNENGAKQNTDTSSEFYKERMMNFLNRCASLEGISNPEISPSVQSESVLNPIPEIINVEINKQDTNEATVTPISWGDTPDHTIYNQNTLNFENIFKFGGKKIQDGCAAKESDSQANDEIREITQNN